MSWALAEIRLAIDTGIYWCRAHLALSKAARLFELGLHLLLAGQPLLAVGLGLLNQLLVIVVGNEGARCTPTSCQYAPWKILLGMLPACSPQAALLSSHTKKAFAPVAARQPTYQGDEHGL